MSKKSAFFLAGIVIIIILIISVGVFYYTKNQNTALRQLNNNKSSDDVEVITSDLDTSDWQVYEGNSIYNKNVKFVIRFPKTWDFRYKLGDQWKRESVIYSKEFGPQNCFLILGAGGHGFQGYKIIEERKFIIGDQITKGIVLKSGDNILGVVDLGDSNIPITFEYHLIEELLDGNCERDIMNIIASFQRK